MFTNLQWLEAVFMQRRKKTKVTEQNPVNMIIVIIYVYYILVGGFNPFEKYKVNMDHFP